MQQKAEQEAHQLVGALGSAGFAEGSPIAQEIEALLGKQNCYDCAPLTGEANQTQFLCLTQLVKELRHQTEIASTEFID